MKKHSISIKSACKSFAVGIIIAALAILSMPLRLIVESSPSVKAESEPTPKSATQVATQAETAPAATVATIKFTINYYRPDGQYTKAKWGVWLWKMGAEGTYIEFEAAKNFTLGGKTWTSLETELNYTEALPTGNVAGFIIRDSGWGKDPDGNRFVDFDNLELDEEATAAANHSVYKVSLYTISATSDFYFNSEDAAEGMNMATMPKIRTAKFTDFSNVKITTSEEITDKSYFKVLDSNNNVIGELDCAAELAKLADNATSATSAITKTKKAATIALTAELDFGQSYKVVDQPAGELDYEKNFAKCAVAMSDLYNTKDFGDKYNYEGTLGAEYSTAQTKFTVWSPYAAAMKLNIYAAGEGGTATSYDMEKGEKGTWSYTLNGDQNGKYYTYTVVNGKSSNEIVDPYARSGGKNGQRGMILDLASTNPTGWDTQNMPTLQGNTHAVIWEAHVRDVTIHESSGVSEANRGKYLGLTETGTKNASGKSTALDYIKELGVTEVHFQPIFDFATVDESFTQATYNNPKEFNWGYDPLNYNMPEGSYSSNPSDGRTRVNELKQMIMALHNAGVQVVMDVVYNHVSSAEGSNFQALMPNYYFRTKADGTFSNGSGCGNETASERYMFRRFMIDSVKYWMTEYKIDGFRFDLMALHDVETMNKIYDELAAINSDVIVYGEGWTADTTPLAGGSQAARANAKKMPNIAFFNDDIRNGLKGSNFDKSGKGFVQGVNSWEANVYSGVYGWTNVNTANPAQNINYVSAHDDSTLWDRLNASINVSKADLKAMNRLAATSVYTGQGIAFMLAGEEMLRNKPTTKRNSYDNRPNPYKTDSEHYFSDNSYKSPDSTNAIDWNLLDENADMIDYYKVLIALKKSWPQFQLSTKEQIDSCVTVSEAVVDAKGRITFSNQDGIISYAIKDPNSNEYAVVILNNSEKSANVSVPKGKYDVYINGSKASATQKLSTFNGNTFTVGARSAVVMKGTLEATAVEGWVNKVEFLAEEESNLGLALGLGIGIPAAVLIAGGVVFGVMYSKKKKGKGKDKTENNNEPEKSDEPEQPEPEQQPATDETEQPEATENAEGDAE